MQVRVSEVHVAGDTTETTEYAVTDVPLLVVPPQGRVQGFAEYVPLKEIVPIGSSVRLCVAGVLYPDAAPQVIVYTPGEGFESEVCEVPEPVTVAGPVIVQEADEMFEETFMLEEILLIVLLHPFAV